MLSEPNRGLRMEMLCEAASAVQASHIFASSIIVALLEMAATMSGVIDLDKHANYPIVLSDALLGRGSKEIFTSIRYNHKPTLPSETTLSGHDLKHIANGDGTQYDLSFSDGSGKYEYSGVRNSGDGQYALVFDPAKKHFVLHQVDSIFDMNLSSTPWNQDPTSLREAYSQIEIQPPPKTRRKNTQPKAKVAQPSRISADTKRRKVEKPKKIKPPPKEPTPDAEDEDSDDGLTIEYPGGAPPPRYQSHPSPLPFHRQDREPSDESDADAEDEGRYDKERNMDVDILELPSPAAHVHTVVANHEEEEDALEQALAAELEEALGKETRAKVDESSESEEE